MLDFSLSPEQMALQKKAREFALKEILPVAWYYDQIDDTPLPVLKKAYDSGLINGDIPSDYGGSSYGLIESVVVTEEFAAACPVEKLLRDARLFRIYEGTSEVQRYIVSGYAMNVYQPAMPPLEDLPIHRVMDPAKVKPHDKMGKTAWRCRICGHVHYGDEAPDECPYCFFPQTAFKKV